MSTTDFPRGEPSHDTHAAPHEREVIRLSKLYAALSHINQAIVRVPTRDELFQKVCRVLVEHGGFRMAWIGWHDPATHQLVPVAVFGDRDDYLQNIHVYTDERPEGGGPSGTAFRSGQPYICNDLPNHAASLPWRQELERRGYQASAALPIKLGGSVCGTLNVYSDRLDFFLDKEVALLLGAAADLSFALDNFARDAAHRRAEQAVRTEKQFSDNLIERIPGILFLCDSAGHFLRWNQNLEAVSGYSADEINRMHPLDFFTGEDKTLVGGRLAEVFATGEASVEAALVAQNGTATPYVFTGRRILFEGNPCMVGVGIDMSDRKRAQQSEERFRELAESIQEVFWMTDPLKSQMLYISPGYEKVWGRSCASLYASPRTWLEAIHPEDRERVLHAAYTKQASGDYDETYRILRPDHSVRWIHDRAFPVRSPAGDVLRIVGTAEDITDRRQLEEQLLQSQKMEAIGKLAGGVAHDFNNILAAILGNTQLALADTAQEHPAHQSLEEIRKASLRATVLVQQILAFSRHQPQELRVIELGPTLREAFSLLRATIPSVVELSFALDPATPPVLADSIQVYQVMTNLCTNAWHALDDRPGRIEVKLAPVFLDAETTRRFVGIKPGYFACLSVSDNGKGMDPSTLERIFDPFFTTKAPGKGTGLGLSVVHGITRGHEGAITVESQPGHGSTFHVYFPAAGAPATIAPPTPVITSDQGQGQHILYLDDEESLVLLVTRILERLGYRVSGFSRAEEAMKAFRDNPDQFDLVITDLNMPGVPGTEIAANLLKLRPNLPVVLCSGHVTDELRQDARNVGIREVLNKPCTMKDLGDVIQRLTHRQ